MLRQARYEQLHVGLLEAGLASRPVQIESIVSRSFLFTL
jgi:hypothetical protein